RSMHLTEAGRSRPRGSVRPARHCNFEAHSPANVSIWVSTSLIASGKYPCLASRHWMRAAEFGSHAGAGDPVGGAVDAPGARVGAALIRRWNARSLTAPRPG